MTRRDWLGCAAALVAGDAWSARSPEQTRPASGRSIATVRGPVAPDDLGFTLMHEHVLVDFIGADKVSRDRYDHGQVVASVLPHLRQVRKLGCETLVECTPAYLGRDPELLKRLSEESGVRILTNTGYYGAANDKHLPAHAFTESADRLAARWIREYERGIDETQIKPAFLKIGVDGAPLSDIDRTLVQAAALTHLETGLPIAAHTSSGAAALAELDLLEAAKVNPSAFIWVHAHSERDEALHLRAAQRGAWVEFDGVSPATAARHADLTRRMKEHGLLSRVLLSHDAGWYRVGEPGGGQFRPYDSVFTHLIPALASAGLDDADVRQLFVANPRRALAG